MKVRGGQFVVARPSEKPGFWVLEMKRKRRGQAERVVSVVELSEQEILTLRAEECADEAIREFATRESPQKDRARLKYLLVRTESKEED